MLHETNVVVEFSVFEREPYRKPLGAANFDKYFRSKAHGSLHVDNRNRSLDHEESEMDHSRTIL